MPSPYAGCSEQRGRGAPLAGGTVIYMDATAEPARTREVSHHAAAAPAREDAAYADGWSEGVRAARAALRKARRGGVLRSDNYVDGWMDAATLQPVDPVRLAEMGTRYARGYADAAKQYEAAMHGGLRCGD